MINLVINDLIFLKLVDKFFKGKMINAVRNIENVNPAMGTWNGDAETIVHTEHYLQPIIDETKQSTKEMVDNYFSEINDKDFLINVIVCLQITIILLFLY